MNALEQALYTTLAADATLTALLATTTSIYAGQAPQDSALPCVVFSKPTDQPENAMANTRVATKYTYLIKAITTSPAKTPSKKTASTIDERIDAVLSGSTLTISGHTNLCTRRMNGVEYPENDHGNVYWHVGALYEVWSN